MEVLLAIWLHEHLWQDRSANVLARVLGIILAARFIPDGVRVSFSL